MKIDLTEEEADYLADKTFWDWKRAEIDTWAIDIRPCPKEAIKRSFIPNVLSTFLVNIW